MNPQRQMFRAAKIADGFALQASPGVILMEAGCILASGRPEAIGDVAGCKIIDLPHEVVIPALVNAHCHLDLTHIGPQPYTGSFPSWVEMVRARRAIADCEIDDSVRRGVELSQAGGTAMVGDIAGAWSLQPLHTMRETGQEGISFVEVFGLGRSQSRAVERMLQTIQQETAERAGVRLGLQPHGPYSCGLEVYRAAAQTGLALSTHLAETPDEIEFVHSGTGPFKQMLEQFGVWDPTIRGWSAHPVEHVLNAIGESPLAAAHVNYLGDEQIKLLARSNVSVVYCPRASEYFGHPIHDSRVKEMNLSQGHRYRDMMQAGVNVALGTDSIICLDTHDRLSVLDEMRLLHRRDGADPVTLLRMATVNGAKALHANPTRFTLQPGRVAGLLAIPIDSPSSEDALHRALMNNSPPRWIWKP